jgi:hypothetical protein
MLEPSQTSVGPVILPGAAFTVTVFDASVPQPVLYLITVVPAVRPSTSPDVGDTDTCVVVALHAPPVAALLINIMLPTHTVDGPCITPGDGVTVTACDALLPQPVLYIMFAVPAPTPVTTRVPEFTVATLVLLLVHTPPATALVSVMVDPWHTVVGPPMLPGAAFTVTVFDASVPQPVLYLITVVPAVSPSTSPDVGDTDTCVVVALHAPPVAALLINIMLPTHTVDGPCITPGDGFTVIATLALLPQPVL